MGRIFYIPSVTSPRKSTAWATLMVVTSALSFGSLSTLTVIVTRDGMSLVNAMFWRYVLAILMLLVLLHNTARLRIERSRILRLVMIGGIGQAVITYSSLYALRYIAVTPLAFLFYTYPVWIAVVAAIRRTERMTRIRLTALGLALAGLAAMLGSPSAESLNPMGVMIALGAAFLYSVYLPAIEGAQRGVDPLVSTFYLVTGVTVSFFILNLVTGQLILPQSRSLWGYVTLLALVCTVLAFRSLIGGLRVLGPVRTSIISTAEPFYTALLGVAILGNHLTAGTLLGGVLIATAVLLLQWHEGERITGVRGTGLS
jgi:drug/metabolite transporter (DMT)-like permease